MIDQSSTISSMVLFYVLILKPTIPKGQNRNRVLWSLNWLTLYRCKIVIIFSKIPKTLLSNLPTTPKSPTVPRKFAISLRLTDLNNKAQGTKTTIRTAMPKTTSTKLEKLRNVTMSDGAANTMVNNPYWLEPSRLDKKRRCG